MLKSKLTWILLALSLLLSALLAYLPTTFCYSNYTDEAGKEVSLTGLASIAYEKERQGGASGIVTPERVREAVEIYQACLTSYGVTESYDLPEGVYEREILPIAPLLHGVKEAFADPNTGIAPSIMEIAPELLSDYDSVCEARIISLMAMEQPDSEAAQHKAVEMYRQIKKPFAVYPGMNASVMDYQNMMGFLILLFCILPASGTSIQASILYAITDFRFLNVEGLAVWTPYAMMGACVIEIPLFSLLTVRSYCGHVMK